MCCQYSTHRFWRPITLGPLVLAMCACSPVAAQELKEFDSDYLMSPAGGPELDDAATVIIRLTNEFRRAAGLPELRPDKKLSVAARYFAAYMARTNKHAHDADGNQPWERVALFKYDYCIVAENIAYQFKSTGFSTNELARKFFEGWKASERHRANMLHAHMTETGVAIGHDPESDRYYAVQLLARPKSAAIQFEVINHTPETIQYAVATSEGDGPSQRTFELPPRATMFHTRCRPATIDWRWTKDDDQIKAENQRAYVIAGMAGGYKVTLEAATETTGE
jgi:uncharacterized protein YkwD